jgi:hypothetical protein
VSRASICSRASRLCDEPHGRRTVGLGVGCSGLDHYVIDVAVAPVFSGLEGPDNRVPRLPEVLGRVLVLRFIAAAYVSANQAFPEMYPLAPILRHSSQPWAEGTTSSRI